MVLEAALSGLESFEGPRSSIGEFIRSKLAEAKQKGLVKFQSDAQTQGAMNLAQLKGDIAGADTKQGGIVSSSGEITPITGGAGPEGTDFPSDFKFITPREGKSEAEQRYNDAIFNLKTEGVTGGNVIEQSAGGSSTPVSNIVNQQGHPAPAQQALSPEEQELLKALEALGG